MSSILPEKPDSPIVSAQWVYDHLGSEDIILVDASAFLVDTPDGKYAYVSGDEEFMVGGHLPGAVFADLINEFSDPSTGVPFSKPDVQRFADAAGAIGADNEKNDHRLRLVIWAFCRTPMVAFPRLWIRPRCCA